MRVAIIGAGPAGLFTGAALARRGHDVVAVDRDAGPPATGEWDRVGVMQFQHAHAFRPQVVTALEQELPAAYTNWLGAGAEPVRAPFFGPGEEIVVGVRSRRVTFERAVREAATAQTGLTVRQGHVDRVTSTGGRATGIVVDGVELAADLVIDASGRSGRATRSLGTRPTIGGPCGIAYVDRLYQLRPGADPGPLVNPIAFQADYTGYQVIVFPHEHGIFSVLVVRPSSDRELALLRQPAAFAAAVREIPPLAEWTHPDRAVPYSPVYAGGTLINAYRGQTGTDGRLLLPGLVFLGDAVCTTTPTFGRGVATTMMQCQEFLRLFDITGRGGRRDLTALGEHFDAWCEHEMRPWVEDHIHMDAATQARWEGHDINLDEPLPSDLIMSAAAVDPAIAGAIPPYVAMLAGPACLRPVEPLARAVYATGWRPTPSPGPTAAELREIVAAAR